MKARSDSRIRCKVEVKPTVVSILLEAEDLSSAKRLRQTLLVFTPKCKRETLFLGSF